MSHHRSKANLQFSPAFSRHASGRSSRGKISVFIERDTAALYHDSLLFNFLSYTLPIAFSVPEYRSSCSGQAPLPFSSRTLPRRYKQGEHAAIFPSPILQVKSDGQCVPLPATAPQDKSLPSIDRCIQFMSTGRSINRADARIELRVFFKIPQNFFNCIEACATIR